MAERSIIIIGAGIGGLAAGCYGRMNGFDTRIFERHVVPGGVCTSWVRKGFTIDGCIHHLAGCRSDSKLCRMWAELGAMPREILFPEDLTQVETPDGKRFTVYTDLDQLEEHMKELAPADRRTIDSYLRAARILTRHDLLESVVTGKPGLLRMLGALIRMPRWTSVPMKTAAGRFSDPFLRKAFPLIQYGWAEIPAMIHLNMLANCHTRNYGFPAGGSLTFVKSIEKRYRDLGGKVDYGACVEKILVENGRAVGVHLADGNEHRADVIVSNASAHGTLFDLLGEEHVEERIRRRHAKPVDKVTMGLHVSFGVARDLSSEPHGLVLFLEEPITIAGQVRDRFDIELFGFDPSLAPEEKGVLKVLFNTSYKYWKDLAVDRSRYAEEKERIAETVIESLRNRFPRLKDQVEAIDVATPLTTERYTGVGQAYGSDDNPGLGSMLSLLLARPAAVPGVGNIYMIGQTVGGGGLPGCAAMGRNLIRRLCKEAGRSFCTGGAL